MKNKINSPIPLFALGVVDFYVSSRLLSLISGSRFVNSRLAWVTATVLLGSINVYIFYTGYRLAKHNNKVGWKILNGMVLILLVLYIILLSIFLATFTLNWSNYNF